MVNGVIWGWPFNALLYTALVFIALKLSRFFIRAKAVSRDELFLWHSHRFALSEGEAWRPGWPALLSLPSHGLRLPACSRFCHIVAPLLALGIRSKRSAVSIVR